MLVRGWFSRNNVFFLLLHDGARLHGHESGTYPEITDRGRREVPNTNPETNVSHNSPRGYVIFLRERTDISKMPNLYNGSSPRPPLPAYRLCGRKSNEDPSFREHYYSRKREAEQQGPWHHRHHHSYDIIGKGPPKISSKTPPGSLSRGKFSGHKTYNIVTFK